MCFRELFSSGFCGLILTNVPRLSMNVGAPFRRGQIYCLGSGNVDKQVFLFVHPFIHSSCDKRICFVMDLLCLRRPLRCALVLKFSYICRWIVFLTRQAYRKYIISTSEHEIYYELSMNMSIILKYIRHYMQNLFRYLFRTAF